jgi:signal transduction histidine kinase
MTKDAVWVGPLAGFVMVGTFFAGGGHDGLSAWEWVSVVIAGLASLSLLVGRWSPEAGVLLPGLLAGAYLACGFDDGPIYLPLVLGAHLTARATPVRQWAPWLAVALASLVSGMGVRAVTTGSGWWHPVGQSIGVVSLTVAAATIGSLVRARQLAAAERAARAVTEEQLRMAQDLHDGIGHGLAVIAMQAGVALHVLDRDPDAARRSLEAIRDASTESLDSLRAELSRLSGAAPRAPRRGLADLSVLADRVRSAGLEVHLGWAGEAADVPGEAGSAAYTIIQEALTNVLRHATARRVEITIDAGAPVRVTVRDDGRGPGPGPAGPGPLAEGWHDGGMGLRGMRARAEALGGSFSAGPGTDGGFVVTAELPW